MVEEGHADVHVSSEPWNMPLPVLPAPPAFIPICIKRRRRQGVCKLARPARVHKVHTLPGKRGTPF